MNRRSFLKSAVIGVGALSLPLSAFAQSVKFRVREEAYKYDRQFGVGIEVKRGSQVYRYGVLVKNESEIPKAKLILLDWANSI